MTKLHDGHAASCLCCKHLWMDYEPDWSEDTPGAGFSVKCGRGHFDLSGYSFGGSYGDSVQTWHDAIHRAQSCDDFDPQ